jgi:invasion protein IalB
MTRQRPRRSARASSLVAALPILLLLDLSANAQPAAKPEGNPPNEKSADQELTQRGQRAAREIKYSDWHKTCFKTPGTNTVCRTSIAGTFETGQSAVRIDLIAREGEKTSRLQLFLPVGLYLEAGVKIRIDRGVAYQLPYKWCFTNTCIAAEVADPKLLKEMETGQNLLLELVDTSLLTVNTSLQLNQFAAVRHGTPAQTFEQTIDE